jgi:hypothetical protein
VKRSITIVLLCACFGCSRASRTKESGEEYITLCGVVTGGERKPLAHAAMELHELAIDTLSDVKANRYELAISDYSGSFKFKAVIPGRQYWLAVVPRPGCPGVSIVQQEARRVAVTAQRRALRHECADTVNVVVDSACEVKVSSANAAGRST